MVYFFSAGLKGKAFSVNAKEERSKDAGLFQQELKSWGSGWTRAFIHNSLRRKSKEEWSKRKAYFILARIVRVKITREGVMQEKGLFYFSKNSKNKGYKRRYGARERLILF
jgi:hypothetical protein